MSFLKNIFGKKDESIQTYSDFWKWFQANEKDFFNVVKDSTEIEKRFFDKISPKLSELKDGYYYLTGMYDDNTVELILTADGNINNIVFVEELVEQAPKINGWKFTALKPARGIENATINMDDLRFESDNMFFYSNDDPDHPDEIDITIIHNDLTKENKKQIEMGTYLFLDIYLGELDFASDIDSLKIVCPAEAQKDLIPIHKLKDFVVWRKKEFIEKYLGIRYNIKDDEHGILEFKLRNGNYMIAVINTQLLNWDSKASHPWIGVVKIKYDGSKNNGMPGKEDCDSLNQIEEAVLKQLPDNEGYLCFGRQTAENYRKFYFACKDFRKPSKVFFDTVKGNKGSFEIEYDIFKDKYWHSFERFRPRL